MKLVWTRILLVSLGLFLSGCVTVESNPRPDTAFPPTAGKFDLERVDEGLSKTYYDGDIDRGSYFQWSAVYSGAGEKLDYRVSVHKNSELAERDLKDYVHCAEKEVWKEIDLPDKAGNKIGSAKICRETDVKKSSVYFGAYTYSFVIADGNRAYRIEPRGATETAGLIEFIADLPLNPRIDRTVFDRLHAATIKQTMTMDELLATAPPKKITSKPYLKEKVLVLKDDDIATDEFFQEASRHAKTADEIGSIVRIECAKGRKRGYYRITSESSLKGDDIPAYGSVCKVTVIDKTIPATISKKTFVNNHLPRFTTMMAYKYTFSDTEHLSRSEYVAPYPIDRVKDFLRNLPEKK